MLSPHLVARLRRRLVFAMTLLVIPAASASAQTYAPEKPPRQFVSVSYGWMRTEPLHFAEHPLADLLGTAVAAAQRERYDYVTSDGATLVDVLEFKRRGQSVGVTVYPFGMSVGPALALRGSIEQMPTIRIAFEGPGAFDQYALTDGRAFDAGIGLFVADRAPGWGLGSHAFVAGGVGRILSDLSGGSRLFAEAGGGLGSGPIGVQLSVKFAWNHLAKPVDHSFLTVPVTLRGTLSF